MHQKLEATSIFKDLSANLDGLGLLIAIKDLVYNFQSQKYLPQALHESARRFYFCQQGKQMSTQAYLEMFQNMVGVLEHSGGAVGNHPGIGYALIKKHGLYASMMTNAQKTLIKQEAQAEYLRVAFLINADRIRYTGMIQDMENDFL